MQAERRFYKRYPVSFKFQLISNDRTYTNEALNLSSDGIQMISDMECAELLSQSENNSLACQILLDVNDNALPITIDCRVVVNRRLSQIKYLIGLRFIGVDQAKQQLIEQYIQKSIINE